MTINLSALQKQRRDTAANWTAENPTLLAGEIGLESDTGYWKVGNGSSAWNSLAYVTGLGAEIPVSRLADGSARQLLQTAANGTDVEWTSNVDVPGTLDVTGAATFDSSVTITGDLTVNGTTTNINTTNLVVEDKNVILGDVATPTDLTADGGGITLKGTTDKTINWVDATDAWTLSEHVNIASGKEYRINGTQVLSSSALGSGVTVGASQLSGTIPSSVLGNSTTYVGTTAVALNRSSANQALTGISSVALPGATSGTITITPAATAGTTAITVPATTGTLITTGDSGTVTSTMIADGTIVNGDVNASAAIAGTKISPDFGAQNTTTTGTSTAASFIPTSSTVPTNGVYLPAANSVALATGGSGRLFVDSGGNVGIGMTPVDVAGFNSIQLSDTNGTYLDFYTSSTHQARIISLPNDLRINQITSGTLGLWTNNTERLRVTSDGKVGVGTSSPSATLHVVTNGNPEVLIGGTQTPILSFVGGVGSEPVVGYGVGSLRIGTVTGAGAAGFSEKVRVDTSGRVGIGSTAPEEKLTIADGLIRLNSTTSTSKYIVFYDTAGIRHVIGSDATAGTNELGIRSEGQIVFGAGSGRGEAARIDSSKRLLVGTSSARSNFYNTSTSPRVQLEGTNTANSSVSLVSNRATTEIYDQPTVVLGRSGGASIGSNTLVANNNCVGSVSYQGHDGSEFVALAEISAFVDGTPGANDMPGRLVFSTTADGSSSPTERMRISSDGAVTIGNSIGHRVNNVNTSAIGYDPGGGAGTAGQLVVVCRGNDGAGTYQGVSLARAATSWSTYSDERLKTDLVAIDHGLDKVAALRSVTGRYLTDEPGTSRSFLIAQDVQQVLPEAVCVEDPQKLSLRYTEVIPLLVAALKESKDRIEQLEQRLTDSGIA